ncbi:MAG: sulfotransferase domain-containing protein [Gomphosphaeria aponina SAG 52.96 = DSM 107014]|uniref:Sulfotransferase domain-containing protein n=1 Tax=Gomphosphaeria aponina SAG 52.96 = DSM 107014 TaxID=1521640 RepID=A0A941GRS1_9CHRO|nr:sulfotransferase domain-containing protein [Gomphosphaeria aponina SAG 52.96 = DSM 107014]
MTLPNFLVIGAPKAGTTTLYHYLKQHPQIYMSSLKEPHFFSYGYDGGNEWSPITNLEAYQALFEDVSGEIAIGEASTSYLFYPPAGQRIHYYLPKVKLIAILRDPAERVYSLLLMEYRNISLKKNEMSFIDYFERAINQSPPIRRGGLYYKVIQEHLSLFSQDQLKICLFEDLKKNPVLLQKEIFQFLGVDENFQVSESMIYNSGGVPKNKLIYQTIEKIRMKYNSSLKQLIPEGLSNQIYGIYLKIRNQTLADERPSFPQEMRQQLIDIFRDDILRLQDFLQRDLSKWLV